MLHVSGSKLQHHLVLPFAVPFALSLLYRVHRVLSFFIRGLRFASSDVTSASNTGRRVKEWRTSPGTSCCSLY